MTRRNEMGYPVTPASPKGELPEGMGAAAILVVACMVVAVPLIVWSMILLARMKP